MSVRDQSWRLHAARRMSKGEHVVHAIRCLDPLAVSDGSDWAIRADVSVLLKRRGKEAVEEVRTDLERWTQLELRPDKKRKGEWFLDVNGSRSGIRLVPAWPIWRAIDAWDRDPPEEELPPFAIRIAWRFCAGNEVDERARPMAARVLAHAFVDWRHLEVELPKTARTGVDARVEILRDQRQRVRDAVTDLEDLFSLLTWERETRPRRTWDLELGQATHLDDEVNYPILKGADGGWRQKGESLMIETSNRPIFVEAILDPDESAWFLTSRRPLASEVTVHEPVEDPHSRQAQAVTKMVGSFRIPLYAFAAAATQARLPDGTDDDMAAPVPIGDLPGEHAWEERQSQALQLAIRELPLCAIKGPPGTGKSTVIVGLVRRLVRAGQRVLLVAPTHVALDEVLRRLHGLRTDGLEEAARPARVIPRRRTNVDPDLLAYEPGRLGGIMRDAALRHLAPFVQDEEQHAERAVDHTRGQAQVLRAAIAMVRRNSQTRQRIVANEESLEAMRDRIQTTETGLARLERELAALPWRAKPLTAAQRHGLPGRIAQLQALLVERRKKLDAEEEKAKAARQSVSRLSEDLKALRSKRTTLREERSDLSDERDDIATPEEVEELKERQQETLQLLRDSRREFGRVRDAKREAHEERARLKEWFAERRVASPKRKREMTSQMDDMRRQNDEVYERIGAFKEEMTGIKRDQSDFEGTLQEIRETLDPYFELYKRIGQIQKELRRLDSEGMKAQDNLRPAERREARTARAVAKARSEVEYTEQEIEVLEGALMATRLREEWVAQTSCLKACRADLRAHEIESVVLRQAADAGNQAAARLHAAADESSLERQLDAAERELAVALDAAGAGHQQRALARRWRDWLTQDDASEELARWALGTVNVVAATTQGIAGSRHFGRERFDVLICDESSRVTRGELLVPAARCGRIVLVGDECQLPPHVEPADEQTVQALATIGLARLSTGGADPDALTGAAFELAERWNIGEVGEVRRFIVREVAERAFKFMQREAEIPDCDIEGRVSDEDMDPISALARAWRVVSDALTVSCFDHVLQFLPPKNWVRLDVQRRMPDEIAQIVRDPVYDGDFRTSPSLTVTPIVTPQFPGPVGFVDTGALRFRDKRVGTGFCNPREADLVAAVVRDHLSASSDLVGSVMVLAFYKAQVHAIQERLREVGHPRAVLPIDRCQGQEADLVVISLVRAHPKPRPGYGLWLQDARRLNVAITRARRKLVLVGSLRMLQALRGVEAGERLIASLVRTLDDHPDWVVKDLL